MGGKGELHIHNKIICMQNSPPNPNTDYYNTPCSKSTECFKGSNENDTKN